MPFSKDEIEKLIVTSVDGMLEATFKASAITATLIPGNNTTAGEIARRVALRILIELADANNADSLLVAIGKRDGAWKSHCHLNYLDADPAHLLDFEAGEHQKEG